MYLQSKKEFFYDFKDESFKIEEESFFFEEVTKTNSILFTERMLVLR